ncbi:hypothetical protein KKI90_10150 [Xenorhabdus bovienii]|uniref:hypothetical protein n=1 Tax=Xenorhabdus bovienii TaxID=40576 RepID=UPI00237C883F|nr:hypothetical protein [Xenorhabdus bovienii]MDE1486746.1 hypothetical protein [Xenorhabdus bovienii]MDE9477298.1 hypothetical protein [Xenorhabdus bovienii]MDE9494748.1 hypothetical protein [Xenorhabdus bovienii]MDE9503045.1 hypothetical protein [Xenorhabdus bovienii]MDE9526838.1 hypothetical protein [Xenorhabdus bovienii]
MLYVPQESLKKWNEANNKINKINNIKNKDMLTCVSTLYQLISTAINDDQTPATLLKIIPYRRCARILFSSNKNTEIVSYTLYFPDIKIGVKDRENILIYLSSTGRLLRTSQSILMLFFKISQPSVSRHLHLLKKKGLLCDDFDLVDKRPINNLAGK